MSDIFQEQLKLQDADAFYQNLIDTHRDLSLEDSHRLNARLVLMMANQIGDMSVLQAILAAGRKNLLASQT
jgi:hypothetical protein